MVFGGKTPHGGYFKTGVLSNVIDKVGVLIAFLLMPGVKVLRS